MISSLNVSFFRAMLWQLDFDNRLGDCFYSLHVCVVWNPSIMGWLDLRCAWSLQPDLRLLAAQPRASLQLPIAYYLLPLAHRLLPTAYRLSPIAYCLLPIACCLLPIAYCLLPIA